MKIEEDYLYLTFRDLDTLEKGVLEVKNPKTDIFITKDECRGRYRTQRHYEEEKNLSRYSVPYNSITRYLKRVIAGSEDRDLMPILNQTPKEAFKWRYSYYSDYNICDYAMVSYLLNNKSYIETGAVEGFVTRSFLDIESDIYGLTTTEADEGMGPINAVSVVVPYDKHGNIFEHPKVFTFLLRNWDRYKEQEYFEKHLDKFIDECHDEFDDRYNEPEFIIKIYDSEVELLRHLFAMLHFYSPDFILIWN